MSSILYITQIHIEPGAIKRLAQECQQHHITRPLIVTDAGIKAAGLLQHALDALPGVDCTVYAGTPSNPTEASVREATRLCVDHQCDGLIALGGGSSMDCAKGVAIAATHPGPLTTYATIEGGSPRITAKVLPLIAIPTTAGTGSEVGRSSVITLDATHRKAVLFNPEMLAKLVILDPALTVGLPPHLTAATGADALTHCIESFTCPSFHPMCDGIALEGVRLIFEALPKAYRDGKDLEARGHMLVAAAMGAVAFQKDLGVVHSLAHPLSSICGMHHGLANALCLVASMRLCSARRPGIYRRVGQAAGLEVVKLSDVEADQVTIAFVESFLAGLGLNKKLSQHGVRPEHLDALVAQAWEDPCHRTNAVPVTIEDLRALYLEVL